MLIRAIKVANELHRGQTRKVSGLPYITHPLDVMRILIEHGVIDHDILTAAVLHDTVEDTEATLESIESDFGAKVAEIVATLTKPDDGTHDQNRQAALHQLQEGSDAAKLIKMADRLSNLATFQELNWSKKARAKYLTEAIAIATTQATIEALALDGVTVTVTLAQALVDRASFLIQEEIEHGCDC